jgi:hypothetical protein
MTRSILRLAVWACLAGSLILAACPANADNPTGTLISEAAFSEAVLSDPLGPSAAAPRGDGCAAPACCPAAFGMFDGCRPPLWTVTADALFLHRSEAAASVLMVNTADPTQNLNAASLRPGTQTGFDLSAIRQFGQAWALEGRYFGFDQWNGAAATATTPGSLLQINTAIPIFSIAGTAIRGDLASKLHNAELNGRWQASDLVTLLAGFRYLELDDHLRMNVANGAIPLQYDTQTRNRLYGMQAGGQAFLWDNGGPLSVDLIGKAGVFGNAAAQNSFLSTGVVTLASGRTTSMTSFIGELALTGRYRWTDAIALRGGYRLLWVDQLALGTDQVAVTAFVPPNLAPGRGIDRSGDLFFHGAFAGLECYW